MQPKHLTKLMVPMFVLILLYGCSHNTVYNSPTTLVSNEQIAFISRKDGNIEIYTMDLDGKNQKNITNNPATDLAPAWSPDGSLIAFSSDRDGNSEIYVMKADGAEVTRLTSNLFSDKSPCWSPDGTKIVFTSDRDRVTLGNGVLVSEVYTMNADGSEQMRLTNDYDFDYSPIWALDGTHIILSSSATGQSGVYSFEEIFTLEINNIEKTNLTPYLSFNNYRPALSPDNKRIVFVSTRDASTNIYIMEADGSNHIALTNETYPNIDPAWSPDGMHIVFASRRDGNYNIYIINKDGSNIIQLTDDPADENSPAWSLIP